MNIFLVELSGYNPATSSEETLRFATRQLDNFEERIKRAGFVKRDMFSSGTTFGGSRPSFGDIELVNSALLDAEGDLDFLNEYAFDGRDIAVYWGPSDGDYPDSFTRLYKATMEAVLVAREKVTIRVLGNSARVDLPLRDEFYSGIGNLQGDDNVAGKPKPFVFGRVNSISPVLVNAEKQIYQVHNGPIDDITVYDRGVPIDPGQGVRWVDRDSTAPSFVSAYGYHPSGVALALRNNQPLTYESLDDGYTWNVYTMSDDWQTPQRIIPLTDYESGGVITLNNRFMVVSLPGSGPAEPVSFSGRDVFTNQPDVSSWTGTNLDWTSGAFLGFSGRDGAWSPELGRVLVVGVDTVNDRMTAYVGDSPFTTLSGTTDFDGDYVEYALPNDGRMTCVWMGGSHQKFVIFGRGSVNGGTAANFVYESPDGETWTAMSPVPTFSPEGPVLYVPENETTVATNVAISTIEIHTSTDGADYTLQASFDRDDATQIAYIPTVGYYILTYSGSGGLSELYFSVDCSTWEQISSDLPEGQDILGAAGGFLLTFDDGYRGYAPANYLTSGDIADPDAAPYSGEYKLYKPGGYLRLGDSASGQVVADVTVGATAADRTVAQAFVTVMDELGTTFTPKSLFADGTKGVWFDPSDPSTVFQDAAATIPAGDGDPVGCILDKSGNDYHATQGTAAARPVLRKTGDVWALEFDGVDDFLTVASMSFTGTEDIFFAAGARRYSSSGAMYLWNMGLSGLNASYPGMSIGPQDFSNFIVRLYMADSSTAASRTAGQWGNLGERVVTVSRSDIYLDQVRQGWSSDINQSFAGQQTRNRIGCRDVGFARQAFWKGTIEQIVFMLRDATTQEREDVTQFIGRRGDFGLPTPGDMPFYDDVSVSVLDSIAPYECGFFLDTTEAIAANVLDQIANSVGAYWGDDRNGLFRIEQIGDPSTETAVATVRDYDMTEPLERLRTQDRGRGIPFWRVALQYARRYTTLSSDFDASVSDAERLRLSTPFDVESYEDAGVRLVHLLSQELIVDSLLQDATDAITEATRQWDLRSVKRDRYQFAVKIDSATVEWDVGDVIRVEHPRFGLSSGKNFWIIGLQLNPRPQTITVTIWG